MGWIGFEIDSILIWFDLTWSWLDQDLIWIELDQNLVGLENDFKGFNCIGYLLIWFDPDLSRNQFDMYRDRSWFDVDEIRYGLYRIWIWFRFVMYMIGSCFDVICIGSVSDLIWLDSIWIWLYLICIWLYRVLIWFRFYKDLIMLDVAWICTWFDFFWLDVLDLGLDME